MLTHLQNTEISKLAFDWITERFGRATVIYESSTLRYVDEFSPTDGLLHPTLGSLVFTEVVGFSTWRLVEHELLLCFLLLQWGGVWFHSARAISVSYLGNCASGRNSLQSRVSDLGDLWCRNPRVSRLPGDFLFGGFRPCWRVLDFWVGLNSYFLVGLPNFLSNAAGLCLWDLETKSIH